MHDKNPLRKLLAMAGVAGLLAATAGSSFAADGWEMAHPRRAQVNQRLDKQDRRIHEEVRHGAISREEGMRLHREDDRIRNEEEAMASRHGGHITPREQAKLNRQEDEVARQLHF